MLLSCTIVHQLPLFTLDSVCFSMSSPLLASLGSFIAFGEPDMSTRELEVSVQGLFSQSSKANSKSTLGFGWTGAWRVFREAASVGSIRLSPNPGARCGETFPSGVWPRHHMWSSVSWWCYQLGEIQLYVLSREVPIHADS